MRTWWQNLSKREQHFLMLGAGFVLLAILYFMLWQPLTNAAAAQRQAFVNNQRLLLWLQEKRDIIKAKPSKLVDNNMSLLDLVDKTLKEKNVAVQKPELLQQEQGLSVQFKQVAFDDLIAWLALLNQQYAVGIKSLEAKRLGDAKPGMVSINLLLEKSE